MTKHPFEYQRPTEKQAVCITRIREKCKEMFECLTEVLPHCRERSLAITRLEEVSMWANKGVVFCEDEQLLADQNLCDG
jgi:hypothetical protein